MKTFILLSVFSGVHLCLAIRSSVGNDASDDCWLRDKYSDIGYDVGNYTTVNVGECGGTTPESSAVSGPRTDCAALHTTEERHLLYCGHFVISVDTIQSCQKVPTTCQRLSHFVTFYQGTTFERTINVGVCRGMCRENMTCMSVSNKTKGISTPNGVRLIPKIEKCACVKPHCYRMSNFEAFPEQRPGVKGKVAVTTKTVDMGKCVGVVKCPGRDRKSANFLDLQLKIVPGCMPDKYNHHSFVSYGGRHVNVSAITTCSCYAGD